MTHQIIIGGGPAATNAIETIRQFDANAKITLISDEPAHSRMAIPYWLSGQITREQTYTGDADYFQRLNVQTKLGQRATSLNTAAKTVATDAGETLAYDNLLIATGSRPVKLPVPGADLTGVTPQWSLAHIKNSLETLAGKTNPRIVLVGAGFIGFIILSALHKRGCQLTVVEREPQVLPKMLSTKSAGYVTRWLDSKGIAVHCGTSVTRIRDADDSRIVETTNGEFKADMVVVAIGVAPNIELASAAGLATDHGILVDEHLRTSDPNVFAAGDCAQGIAMFNADRQVHAIHPTAVDHGRVAGANMAGQNISYGGSLSMNVLDVCGLQCVSYGNWHDPAAESTEIDSPSSNVYRNLLWTNDRITGAMFVGQADNVGMLTDVGMVKGLMQTQTSLGPWKDFLKNNPFDIRRAYVGTKVASKLAATTLLGRPAVSRSFRFDNTQPTTTVTPHHKVYVETKPS